MAMSSIQLCRRSDAHKTGTCNHLASSSLLCTDRFFVKCLWFWWFAFYTFRSSSWVKWLFLQIPRFSHLWRTMFRFTQAIRISITPTLWGLTFRLGAWLGKVLLQLASYLWSNLLLRLGLTINILGLNGCFWGIINMPSSSLMRISLRFTTDIILSFTSRSWSLILQLELNFSIILGFASRFWGQAFRLAARSSSTVRRIYFRLPGGSASKHVKEQHTHTNLLDETSVLLFLAEDSETVLAFFFFCL